MSANAPSLAAWVTTLAKRPARPPQRPRSGPRIAERVLVPRHTWAAAFAALSRLGAPIDANASTNYRALIVRTSPEGAGMLHQHHCSVPAPADATSSDHRPPEHLGELDQLRELAAALARIPEAHE